MTEYRSDPAVSAVGAVRPSFPARLAERDRRIVEPGTGPVALADVDLRADPVTDRRRAFATAVLEEPEGGFAVRPGYADRIDVDPPDRGGTPVG